MDIQVRPDRTNGPLKKLHGVNNGPVSFGSLVDVTEHFHNAEFPLVRLHDVNWPHAWEVDIHTIFPNFDRDPEDPASYDFERTDAYLASVLSTGAKIVYRLGESIEHTKTKYYVHPPKDYEKWAKICLGIIRHYNEGWANGFQYGIEYWEIWNEPDNPDNQVMWTGTAEQYYELYRVASLAIKRHDSTLKVGGHAATMVNHPFTQGFIEYCRTHVLPLDFFTWHTYAGDPETIATNSRLVNRWLEEAGYSDMECHLNEWGFFKSAGEQLWKPEGAMQRQTTFERIKNEEGASFAAALFALLQDCPVHEANYYDAQPHNLFCGLFDRYGVPTKVYDVFRKFNELCGYSHRIEAETGDGAQGVYALAVTNDSGGSALWISNFGGESREYRISWPELGSRQGEWLIMDRERRFDRLEDFGIAREDGTISVFLPKHSVLFVKFD